MANGSKPLSSYPALPVSESPPSGLPLTQVYSGSSVGSDAGAHSSTSMSIPMGSMHGEGAQWNDDEDGTPSQGHLDPGGYDPNMSGPHHSEPIQERWAGAMSPFQENQDYLDFMFNTEDLPLSRLLACTQANWSYTDTVGGIMPTQNPGDGSGMAFGSDSNMPQGEFGSPSTIAGIAIQPIVRRK